MVVIGVGRRNKEYLIVTDNLFERWKRSSGGMDGDDGANKCECTSFTEYLQRPKIDTKLHMIVLPAFSAKKVKW